MTTRLQRARYAWCNTWAAAWWALAMLLLWRAYRLALESGRVAPDLPAPNCWIWASQEFDRAERQWVADGCPEGREPYGVGRRSRSWPHWVFHALVGQREPTSGFMDLHSFKPDTPKPSRWWRVAADRINFKGSVHRGDD